MLEEAGGDALWDDTAGLLARTFDSADAQLRESTIASEAAAALQPCNPATLQPAAALQPDAARAASARTQAATLRLCTQVSGSTGVAVLLQGQRIWLAYPHLSPFTLTLTLTLTAPLTSCNLAMSIPVTPPPPPPLYRRRAAGTASRSS